MTDPVLVPPYCAPKPWLDKAPWYPVDAPLRGLLPRSRQLLRDVVAQFEVTTTKRYARTEKDTFCNIFAWDVTRAMGAELPHWTDVDGAPVTPGKGRELDADGCRRWLVEHGAAHGWRECTQLEAQLAAEAGEPAVVCGLEHIAVVVPVSGCLVTCVTQAGAHNFEDAPLTRAWRATDIPKLLFFSHA